MVLLKLSGTFTQYDHPVWILRSCWLVARMLLLICGNTETGENVNLVYICFLNIQSIEYGRYLFMCNLKVTNKLVNFLSRVIELPCTQTWATRARCLMLTSILTDHSVAFCSFSETSSSINL